LFAEVEPKTRLETTAVTGTLMNSKFLTALIIAVVLWSIIPHSVWVGAGRALTGERSAAPLATSRLPAYFRDLGTMGGISAQATGVSADGSVIVGFFNTANKQHGFYGQHAFRWTASGGAQDLGTMGGISADAGGVSADGSVIVGSFGYAPGATHAYRWTQSGGVQDLGTMGGILAIATGASADGSVIVGGFGDANNITHAYRWTQSGGR
jgi:probable HAF family extracellular repeat protein